MIKQGKAKLLYLAPEALLRANVLALLATVEVDCLAVDEALSISQWGHDFRPKYRRLIEARDRFPKAACCYSVTRMFKISNTLSIRNLLMKNERQIFISARCCDMQSPRTADAFHFSIILERSMPSTTATCATTVCRKKRSWWM